MTLVTALKHYNTLLKHKNRYYYDYDSAIDLFIECAKEGNPEAQYYLGECFYYGRGAEKDLESAAACLTISSKNGNSKACCLIGIMMRHKAFIRTYIDYSDVNSVMIKVHELYKRAIELDPENEFAKFKIAELLYYDVLPGIDKNSKTYTDTLQEVFSLCAQTSAVPEAYALIAKGFHKPINLYIKAVKLGHMKSLMMVSELYFEEKQYDEMTWWYWWAVKYDPGYSNKYIEKAIECDKLLSEIYKNMPFDKNTKCREMKKTKKYNRVYEEVHKRWFLSSYNNAKLLSDYVPYDEKMRITNELRPVRIRPIITTDNYYYDYTGLFIDATMISNKLNSEIKKANSNTDRDFLQKLNNIYNDLIYKAIQPLNDIVVLQKYNSHLKSPDTYKKIIDECQDFITKSSLGFSHNMF